MTHEPTTAWTMDGPGVHHPDHDDGGYSAKASLGERAFVWIAWALAAVFIGSTMLAYIPGFLGSAPPQDRAEAIAASPAAAADPAVPPATPQPAPQTAEPAPQPAPPAP